MTEPTHPNEINRDYIRLLQAISRFIREEFSVSIRMTQENAVEHMLQYAEQSRNTMLQEMGKELRELTYGPEPEAQPEEVKPREEEGVRYYRGAPVAESKPAKAEDKTEKTPDKSKPTRVYRGQVVHS